MYMYMYMYMYIYNMYIYIYNMYIYTPLRLIQVLVLAPSAHPARRTGAASPLWHLPAIVRHFRVDNELRLWWSMSHVLEHPGWKFGWCSSSCKWRIIVVIVGPQTPTYGGSNIIAIAFAPTLTASRCPRRRVEPAGHAFHAVHEKPKLEAHGLHDIWGLMATRGFDHGHDKKRIMEMDVGQAWDIFLPECMAD